MSQPVICAGLGDNKGREIVRFQKQATEQAKANERKNEQGKEEGKREYGTSDLVPYPGRDAHVMRAG